MRERLRAPLINNVEDVAKAAEFARLAHFTDRKLGDVTMHLFTQNIGAVFMTLQGFQLLPGLEQGESFILRATRFISDRSS